MPDLPNWGKCELPGNGDVLEGAITLVVAEWIMDFMSQISLLPLSMVAMVGCARAYRRLPCLSWHQATTLGPRGRPAADNNQALLVR